MLTRLKLQRGEGTFLVATPEVMPRIRRATRPKSPPPKVLIPATLETPQVFPSIDIEEVQVVLIYEPKSLTIMSGERELEGPSSEEEEFKKSFYILMIWLKSSMKRGTLEWLERVLNLHMEKEAQRTKNMRRRIPKVMVERHVHLHHPHHLHHLTKHHLPLSPLKLPILILKPQKEKLHY